MFSSPHTNKVLIFIVIAVAVMFVVMSILIGLVYFSSAPRSNSLSDSLTQTWSVEETLASLVSTMSVSTSSPQAAAQDINTPLEDTAVDGGATTDDPVSDDIQQTEPPPSLSPSRTPTGIPVVTKTPIPWVESTLQDMTLSQKVGQMILTGVNGTALTAETCRFIQRVSPGGTIYLSTNISSPYPDQLASFSAGLQNCMAEMNGVPLLVSIDHEGSYVNRFPPESQMTIFPPAMAVGATRDPEFAYQAALGSGLELRANGINMVLGPVADVLIDYDNTVISQRAYGGDPLAVRSMVEHAVQGYLSAGILPVLKHFPGHGGVAGDSHAVLPLDQADLARLVDTHLVPFQGGIEAGAAVIMVSHVAFPAIDPQGLPASLSAPLYQLLDDPLGFQGFTLSDSMGMGAVNSTGLGIEAASIEAVNAGLDMLMLISPDLAESVHNSLVEAVQNGQISTSRVNQAVRRILTVKFNNGVASAPPTGSSNPNWSQNTQLARQIGFQAVSLYKDQERLVPLPADIQDILIVGPADGWGLYPLLRNALDQRGVIYNIMTFSNYWFAPVPETSYLQSVPARAAEYDLVMIFTWDSHPNQFRFGDTFQPELVNSLLAAGHQVIVIALKSPTDILDFQGVPTYLATMGTTPGQLQGLIDILMGLENPAGQIPLPGLTGR